MLEFQRSPWHGSRGQAGIQGGAKAAARGGIHRSTLVPDTQDSTAPTGTEPFIDSQRA